MNPRSSMDPRTSRFDPASGHFHAVVRDGVTHEKRMSRAQIVEQAEREACEHVDRYLAARSYKLTGTIEISPAGATEHHKQIRRHCFNCGVVESSHSRCGCKRWVAA